MNPRIPTYDTSWLDLRYPYDAAARQNRVARELDALAAAHEVLHLTDLGAGNGSNTRYWLSRLDVPQHWVLIEQDPRLISAGRAQLSAWAVSQGWEVSQYRKVLSIHRPGGVSTVQWQEGNLLDVARLASLDTMHAVLGNAVLDLLRQEEIELLLYILHPFGLPLYLSLNYTGMHFFPSDPDDTLMIQWYEQHMSQLPYPKLGAAGPAYLRQYAATAQLDLITDTGDWHIQGDAVMQDRLLGFMEEAIPELITERTALIRFQDWLKRRRALAAGGQLTVTVVHEDSWISPPLHGSPN